MDWKKIALPSGAKLFKMHHFTFVHKGSNYSLEIDEYLDGLYAGYGEHTTDKNFYVESVSGKTFNECLDSLVKKIVGREG